MALLRFAYLLLHRRLDTLPAKIIYYTNGFFHCIWTNIFASELQTFKLTPVVRKTIASFDLDDSLSHILVIVKMLLSI